MYEADIDRDAIHDRLGLLINFMQHTNTNNRFVIILFLTEVAKCSGEVSEGYHHITTSISLKFSSITLIYKLYIYTHDIIS